MAAEATRTAGGMLLAAAAALPTLACAVADLGASPYERALVNAWCGAPHAAALGHCPACWTGAAALAAAAAWVAAWKPSRRRILA